VVKDMEYMYEISDLEQAKSLVKRYSEPIILQTLASTPVADNLLTVVVGGAALSAWLKTDRTFTSDFDIRIVAHKSEYYAVDFIDKFAKPALNETVSLAMHDHSTMLADLLVNVLNEYFDNNIFLEKIKDQLKTLGFELALRNHSVFMKNVERDVKLITIAYTLNGVEQTEAGLTFPTSYKVSLVDLLAINNGSVLSNVEYHYLYQGDLFKTKSKFPIPHFVHHGVNFCTLGYTLWDLDRMIENNETRKVERYRYKKILIQTALNDTPLALNCQALRETVEVCKNEYNDEICELYGLPYDIDSLITLGVEQNFLPNNSYILDEIKKMGIIYICDFIKRMDNSGKFFSSEL
jgi:hypothetical protein